MLSYTRLTFHDEFSIFWLLFFPSVLADFTHILHQSNADPDLDAKQCAVEHLRRALRGHTLFVD
jgi:hypothetical protein